METREVFFEFYHESLLDLVSFNADLNDFLYSNWTKCWARMDLYQEALSDLYSHWIHIKEPTILLDALEQHKLLPFIIMDYASWLEVTDVHQTRH